MIQGGKILLVQESYEQARGLWSFPLGAVELGESESCAAEREAEEESGYKVKTVPLPTKLILAGPEFRSSKGYEDCQIELSIFDADVIGGTLSAGADILDAKWFDLSEAVSLPLRGAWMKPLFEKSER